ncbi:MAG: DUF481 domain-containing protein [bacterium]
MKRQAKKIILFIGITLLISITAVNFSRAAEEEAWEKMLRISASLTDVSSAHTDEYTNVTGVSTVEEKTSWLVGVNGRFNRDYKSWSQKYRFAMNYGKTDDEVSEDDIDASSIFRYNFTEIVHGYGSARVRSEFDTFGHPTKAYGATGLGVYLFQSDKYGELDLRLGPRGQREWNPSVELEAYYEVISEYTKKLEGGRFTSMLETYAPAEDAEKYTVRWDNKLIASLNSWLDIEYSFLLYYEDEIGETATKNVSHVNIVYNFWP